VATHPDEQDSGEAGLVEEQVVARCVQVDYGDHANGHHDGDGIAEHLQGAAGDAQLGSTLVEVERQNDGHKKLTSGAVNVRQKAPSAAGSLIVSVSTFMAPMLHSPLLELFFCPAVADSKACEPSFVFPVQY
jgi:hypothetical protein